MTSWTPDELNEIGAADELRIASRRGDGSLRSPVPIWVVRVGDGVFVRGARGAATGWNRHARDAGAGHVTAGSVDRDTVFEPADPALADAITDAYEAKYAPKHPRQYVDPVVGPDAVPTALRIVPA